MKYYSREVIIYLQAESEGTMATQIVELKVENKELKTRLGKAEQRLSDLEIVIFDATECYVEFGGLAHLVIAVFVSTWVYNI